MFLPIKLVCDRRARSNGTNVISIQYCFSSERRTLLFTGMAIPIKHWNNKKSCILKDLPESYGNAEKFNQHLRQMLRVAEDIVQFASEKQIEQPISFLKKVFRPNIEPHTLSVELRRRLLHPSIDDCENADFFWHMDDYIKSKTRKVSVGMVRTYRVMKKTFACI